MERVILRIWQTLSPLPLLWTSRICFYSIFRLLLRIKYLAFLLTLTKWVWNRLVRSVSLVSTTHLHLLKQKEAKHWKQKIIVLSDILSSVLRESSTLQCVLVVTSDDSFVALVTSEPLVVPRNHSSPLVFVQTFCFIHHRCYSFARQNTSP